VKKGLLRATTVHQELRVLRRMLKGGVPQGIAEVPLKEVAVDAFRKQLALSGPSSFLFPSEENSDGYQKTFKTVWHATLRRAEVRYFRIYDLRSTYATRLSAGGVADERGHAVAPAGRCEGFQEDGYWLHSGWPYSLWFCFCG
jgi:hypothetical protein